MIEKMRKVVDEEEKKYELPKKRSKSTVSKSTNGIIENKKDINLHPLKKSCRKLFKVNS